MVRRLVIISLALSALLDVVPARARIIGDRAGNVGRAEDTLLQGSQQRDESARQIAQPGLPATSATLQLSRRLEALERQVAALVSAMELAQRDLSQVRLLYNRQKADVEARLVALEISTDRGDGTASNAGTPNKSATVVRSAEQQFLDAKALAARGEWAKAELEFDTFNRSYPDHPQAQEARFWFGKSLAANGRTVQAAQVFLNLYEQHPDAPFALDNLMALGAALAVITPDDTAQACQVYDQIITEFQYKLDLVSKDAINVARLRLGCK